MTPVLRSVLLAGLLASLPAGAVPRMPGLGAGMGFPHPTNPPPMAAQAMAHPPRRGDSEAAVGLMREGRIRPLREIESRVVPRMPGASYLGPEFDGGTGTYRLKFMRNGSVIWLDVDGRTGEIIGRSGD